MMYITNREGSIKLPNEPGLLEWLQQRYPVSGYYLAQYQQEKCNDNQKTN
jgi:hypothetical protein